MPDLIPIGEAAVEFGAAQTSLYRYLKAGRLKRYKKAFDRRTYVDRQELKRLVRPQLTRERPNVTADDFARAQPRRRRSTWSKA